MTSNDDDDDDDYMTRKHRALLSEYIAEFREAKKVAEKWWQDLVGSEIDESWKAAVAAAKRRWPDGAPSHPFVVGVIVKYAKACDALNRSLDRADRVPINQFLIDALSSTDTEDLAEFTEPLSYWPLGLDEDGRSV
jgi:hypothetical protein